MGRIYLAIHYPPASLQRGTIDRALFTANANAYFSAQALQDFAASLGPLGAPTAFTQSGQSLRGGMVYCSYRAAFPSRTLRVWTFETPDGRLEPRWRRRREAR